MKQLFMVLTVLLLLALPSYATAEKCDYTLTDKEIEKELNNLLEGDRERIDVQFSLLSLSLQDLSVHKKVHYYTLINCVLL